MKVRRYVLLVLPFIFLASILPILGYAADRDRQSMENLLEDLEKKVKEAEQRMVAYPKFLEELKGLIREYRSRLRESYHQGPGPAHLSRIEGSWFVNCNNLTGRLEFHWTGNAWTGRIWFDAFPRWEELTDVFIDPRTGQVQFVRYGKPPQQYYGTLSGDRIEGTFGPPGAPQAFPWTASRH